MITNMTNIIMTRSKCPVSFKSLNFLKNAPKNTDVQNTSLGEVLDLVVLVIIIIFILVILSLKGLEFLLLIFLFILFLLIVLLVFVKVLYSLLSGLDLLGAVCAGEEAAEGEGRGAGH